MATVLSRRKKGVAIALAAALTLGGAGIAFAYWTSTGLGTGSATTGEDVSFTIAADAPVGTIAPGGAGQTVDFTVTNAGEGTQYLSGVTVEIAGAPGIPPVAISGRVTNDSEDSTVITAVRVQILSVASAPSAPAGSCAPSDYVIHDPEMPVGVTLAPGASTSFSGASIGFQDKTTNQDACKNAVVRLLYTANPPR